ncbi:hypothetical protein DM860_008129 [Cuscuta australis]|uniref:Strictosidine synthase conserved region domain-containing protein n=1 Tax=Cuscuta australis TaxID=267555 RepID=A0A328D6L8_9ASTE|nr:hypothetical protein DM860_008129 [Cuscuta australis]
MMKKKTMAALLLLLFRSMFLFSLLFLLPGAAGDGPNPSRRYGEIPLPGGLGPESIAFDCNGAGPYVGVSDGRVLKWNGRSRGWSEFSIPLPNRNRALCDRTTDPNSEPLCGRPLGLKFDRATCDLYIADAYFGLLRVGPAGGVAEHLAGSAEGVPFRLTNGLDIDERTGTVYFTDSSAVFQRREYLKSFNRGERTGRVLAYHARDKRVRVLYRGLAFPNGIALSRDGSFLVVAEGGTRRLYKFRLGGGGGGLAPPELFAQLIRAPDNVKRNGRGEFWVALNSGRSELRDETLAAGGVAVRDSIGIKFAEDGRILQFLDGYGSDRLSSVSEVEEHNGRFYLGSAVKPYVGVLRF